MPEVSVITAADRAIQETGRQLFPFRAEKWLALGFVAFLDQCGSGGGTGNIPNPGGGSHGGGGGGGTDEIKQTLSHAIAYLSSHIGIVMAVAAGVLVLILGLSALVLWLRSRGTFMYLDNVETGRADIVRPWHEHAARANSYFSWLFGLVVAQLCVSLVLLAAVLWAIVSLVRDGARTGPIVMLVGAVLLLIAMGLCSLLFTAILRNFVAPLQWYTGLSCGGALGVFRGLLKTHLSTFVVFFLLKIVYGFVAGIVMTLVACCACCGLLLCFGLLPVLQVVLQPLFYFERRWSLELLHQLGYGPQQSPVSEVFS